MGRFYTEEDIPRWEKACDLSINTALEKLATDLPEQKIQFYMGMLPLSYESRGMISIAKDRYDEAIQNLRLSVESLCKQYERHGAGKAKEVDAGMYQSLLIAFVTRDQALVSRLAGHYRAEEGTPGSIFLGKAVKVLTLNDLDGAKEALSLKRPHFEGQFVGYAECLAAIADKDPQRFKTALEMASKSWAKVVARRDRGLPYSVCFVQGAGLVRLAEKIVGERIAVTNEHIPAQLLE